MNNQTLFLSLQPDFFWKLKKLKDFDIAHDSLSGGEHQFQFEIGAALFEFFDYTDFNELKVLGKLTLKKESSHLNLHFSAMGTLTVNCDRCNEELDLKINGEHDLIVKFSSKDVDARSEEIVYLSSSDTVINVAEYFYEMIVLSIPLKRIHKSGECNQDVIDYLNSGQRVKKKQMIPDGTL